MWYTRVIKRCRCIWSRTSKSVVVVVVVVLVVVVVVVVVVAVVVVVYFVRSKRFIAKV